MGKKLFFKVFSLVVLVLFVFTFFAPAVSAGPKLRIIVISFKVSTHNAYQLSKWNATHNVAKMVSGRLSRIASYKVLDYDREDVRRRVGEIFDEQEALRIARAKRAHIAVIGNVVDFDMRRYHTRVPFVGSVDTTTAHVEILGKIIDVKSGSVIREFRAEGNQSQTNYVGLDLPGVYNLSFGSSEFWRTLVGKASTEAINRFAEEVVITTRDIVPPAKEDDLPEGVLFTDKFASSDLKEWTFFDSPPELITNGPSQWLIENGVLVQKSAIRGQSSEGTFAVCGDDQWGNYVVTAKTRPATGNGVGVIFRMRDERNYYRFLMVNSPEFGGPSMAIEKVINGNPTVLARIEKTFNTGEEVLVQVTAKDDFLSVMVNNQEILNARDGEFRTGKAGLFCFGQPGIMFSNFMVKSI